MKNSPSANRSTNPDNSAAEPDTLYDLRSDTFTMPTPGMRQAIAQAEVGDDVFGEDPTVRRLEETAARLTGKPAALFVSSGTMGNLIALMLGAGRGPLRGKEVILHEKSHIVHYELTGIATLAGALPITVPAPRGILTPEAVQPALKQNTPYYQAETALLAVENSHNFAGGTVYSLENLKNLRNWANQNNLPIHMDGARLFNAAPAAGSSPEALCAPVDTVTFCLSKGLGAPMGALLCGPAPFIREARPIRKMLGGGMRQIGFMAAAGLYALDHQRERLAEDNRNAQTLARTLADDCPWAEIDASAVETNILFFQTPGRSAAAVAESLASQGIRAIPTGPQTIRFVTSLQVPSPRIPAVQEALRRFQPPE